MEKIREAVERARATQSRAPYFESPVSAQKASTAAVTFNRTTSGATEVELDCAHLQSNRIISFDGADPRSHPYNVLRTQLLQTMALNQWKILGVTSATPGCGKTVTAANLAFSVARQPDQSVALVDLDFQKPEIAGSIGLPRTDGGLANVIQGHAKLGIVPVSVRVGNVRLDVLPTTKLEVSSDLMASRATANLLQVLRTNYKTVIVDLPPLLYNDNVIALLPQLDCVLLVAAVGVSKRAEIEKCIRHMRSNQLIRLVLNMANEPTEVPYGY
jgi:protein-tyrosine kinase